MRHRFVTSCCLLIPVLLGCGAATGIPDGLTSTSSRDAGHPVHDASAPPFSDASRSDASTHDASSPATDASRPDAPTTGSDARADATFDASRSDAAPDGSSPPNTDERVSGAGFSIFGVTDGGLLIYGDRAGTCWATPFTGGASTAISPASLTSDAGVGPCAAESLFVVVSHDVVLMSNGYVAYSWTAALGAPALLPFSEPVIEGANPLTGTASADSRYILWAFLSDFGPASYAVAAVDGSDALPLMPGCVFDASFAVCGWEYPPDLSLKAFAAETAWSPTVFRPVSEGFAVDAVGSNVLFLGSGGLTLAPLDGGPPTIIDPAGGTPEYLAPDGSRAIYLGANPDGATSQVEAVTLPGGTPYAIGTITTPTYLESVHLATPIGPVAVLQSATPGFTPGTGPGPMTLLAVTPGATAPVVPTSTCELAYFEGSFPLEAGDDGFTVDGTYVLLFDRATNALEALPIAGGGAASVLSTNSTPGIFPLTGTRVLFPDAYGESDTSHGTGDLRVADVALGTTSTLVASQADLGFAVSPDKTLLAYTLNQGTSADGLYVVPIPTSP